MDAAQIEALVARLEVESGAAPRRYQLRVAGLALLGFAIIGLVIGFAGLALLLMAGIVAALAFFGAKAIVLVVKLGKLLLLVAIPLWFLLKSSLTALFARIPIPVGVEIARTEAPRLFDELDRLRTAMRGPRFHHVLVVDDMNAWMTQRPLFGIVGFPRNYLALGLPLLESMTAAEALAVVAHEYGHLAGAHARFGAFIYRLRNTWAALQQATEQWEGRASAPLKRLIDWYAPYFNAYTFVLARAHEYAADHASAALVSAEVAGSALKRSSVAGAHHDRFLEDAIGAVDQPSPPPDLTHRWAAEARRPPAADVAAGWLDAALRRPPAWLDTHPGLPARLKALGVAEPRMAELPPPLDGPSAAEAWLGTQVEALRDRFQAEWLERVDEAWRERHAQHVARRARFDELAGMAARSAEEEIAYLQLRETFAPDADADLADAASFNAAHADHPGGLFHEALLRLARDDEAGLALLDRAMSLDPDAIKPGCERAYAFLKARGEDARAEAYADRWRERHARQAERLAQYTEFDPAHELRAADELSAGERLSAIANVRGIAGVGTAWLVRRVLPAAPDEAVYVLAFSGTFWSRLLQREKHIAGKLAACDWPVPYLHFVPLTGAHAKLKARLKAIPGAHLQG